VCWQPEEQRNEKQGCAKSFSTTFDTISAIDGTLLSGITRDSIIIIAGELGISVREQSVPREALYTADELFFTGTATEVAPIRSVDRITVGSEQAGPITLMLQRRFMEVVRGERPDSSTGSRM